MLVLVSEFTGFGYLKHLIEHVITPTKPTKHGKHTSISKELSLQVEKVIFHAWERFAEFPGSPTCSKQQILSVYPDKMSVTC